MLQFLCLSRKAQRTSFLNWVVTLKLVALPIVSSYDSIPAKESAILPSMAFYAEFFLLRSNTISKAIERIRNLKDQAMEQGKFDVELKCPKTSQIIG